MNIENLKKFRDYFEAQPDEQYDQTSWAHGAQSDSPCGTPSCIGGHLALYLQRNHPLIIEETAASLVGIGLGWHHKLARNFFEVPQKQATFLFLACPFKAPGAKPPTKAEAVTVLDILIETGEVDWEGARKRVSEYEAWAERNRGFFTELGKDKEGNNAKRTTYPCGLRTEKQQG